MSKLPDIVTNVLQFAEALRPVITRLFDKHKGNIPAAKRDMESLLSSIQADEDSIDAELERQAAEERARNERDTEPPDGE